MKKLFLAAVLFMFIVAPAFALAQVIVQPGGAPLKGTSFSTNAGPSGVNSGSSGADCNLTSGGLKALVNCLIGFMDKIVILLVAAAVVMVMYGAFIMITSEEKRASGRQTVIYGIVGLFIMVSVWGFVQILQNTFTLSNTPVYPQSFQKIP